MTETETPSEKTYNALDRLYDDPEDRIALLQDVGAADQDVTRQETVFKALGNENRLRILRALRESECCGCELEVVLDAPQSTVATHLRKLKEAGLVKSRKKGKWSYYRISDSAVFELLDLAHAIQEDA